MPVIALSANGSYQEANQGGIRIGAILAGTIYCVLTVNATVLYGHSTERPAFRLALWKMLNALTDGS